MTGAGWLRDDALQATTPRPAMKMARVNTDGAVLARMIHLHDAASQLRGMDGHRNRPY